MKWLIACALILGCVGLAKSEMSNEGTQFAVALPSSSQSAFSAELIINARQTTEVLITTSTLSDVVTVYGNSSVYYELDRSMRPQTDIEEKGIFITSDELITIHIATITTYDYAYSSSTPDTVLARPVSISALEYFLAGYDYAAGAQGYPRSVYMVVATEDNTDVDVYYADNGIAVEDEHFTLQKYEVFTRDTRQMFMQPAIDFTGTRIMATKPVSVYSGHGEVRIYATGGNTHAHYIMESMPALSELGTEYTTFPVRFGGDGGYETRVIAVVDDTDVTVPSFSTSLTLNMGEFHIIDNTVTRRGFQISCSKPCQVAQYLRALPAGGDTGLAMGTFLAMLVPDGRSSDHLIFTVPTMSSASLAMKAAISIIVDTFPMTGLFLNAVSLADLDWQPAEDSSNWVATVEVQAGFYQLHSIQSSERFTAYLYVVNAEEGNVAVGCPIGYSATMMS